MSLADFSFFDLVMYVITFVAIVGILLDAYINRRDAAEEDDDGL